jgi:hypothetical protein
VAGISGTSVDNTGAIDTGRVSSGIWSGAVVTDTGLVDDAVIYPLIKIILITRAGTPYPSFHGLIEHPRGTES